MLSICKNLVSLLSKVSEVCLQICQKFERHKFKGLKNDFETKLLAIVQEKCDKTKSGKNHKKFYHRELRNPVVQTSIASMNVASFLRRKMSVPLQNM